MSNVITFPKSRTLANVLLEISEAHRESQMCDRMCARSPIGSPEEEHWSDRGAAADERLDRLRDEAGAMIEAATGCTWAQIEEAMQ